MHLHARRLIIDHPGGDKLDVTAELPEHFAATMEQLGFDQSLSDAAPTEGPPPLDKVARKQKARAHAKQARKARPSRRGRGAAKPKAGPGAGRGKR
jgi:23S rRNA pseudouridine955/2504/2580 synthase